MYEKTAKGPDDAAKKRSAPGSSKSASPNPDVVDLKTDDGGEGDGSLTSVAAALGYSQAGATTMGFLRRIENSQGGSDGHHGSTHGSSLHTPGREDHHVAVKEKFKALIRQLPPKTHLDRLLDIYLSTFNYQYYPVEPGPFRAQLSAWHALPFRQLSTTGPHELSADMRAFPGMLFQMIATALLVVPEPSEAARGGKGSEEGERLAAEFGALKYAAGMTFEDLAGEYSEAGVAIVGLFDKRGMSMTTIQAEFLRGAFLKFTGQVTDSVGFPLFLRLASLGSEN